jgi:predicted nucleic acid-binding protein
VLTQHELVISNSILDEVAERLREKFNFPENEIGQLRRLLQDAATTVSPAELRSCELLSMVLSS